MATNTSSAVWYGRFLLFIAGMGSLLYGIDVGIIAAVLLYLGKTISLTVEETSFIVAAVLGGSMFSSLLAGILADWFGRKKMMVVSGLMFVGSVGLIVISQAFLPLFLGALAARHERRRNRRCDSALPRRMPQRENRGGTRFYVEGGKVLRASSPAQVKFELQRRASRVNAMFSIRQS